MDGFQLGSADASLGFETRKLSKFFLSIWVAFQASGFLRVLPGGPGFLQGLQLYISSAQLLTLFPTAPHQALPQHTLLPCGPRPPPECGFKE